MQQYSKRTYFDGQFLARFQIRRKFNAEALFASQSQTIGSLSVDVFQRNDAHSDQIWAMDSFKRFDQNSTDSLKHTKSGNFYR